ncbi:MAG TPA: hypothetical protein VLA56_11620 [Pseudomonadales bacterium]|nr:hypothetical protein [Pseudomonadales bacterium]
MTSSTTSTSAPDARTGDAPRALALLSGGLDSMLAARVVMDQGVHVEAVNFYTGFCVEGHTRALRPSKGGPPKRHDALWVAEQLGIRLHIVDVAEDYKSVVIDPRFGYGAHLNPCLDCKIFMATRADDFARDRGFDFLITGEVLDQRPKSQRPEALPLIARASGTEDRLLRPLSAHHLRETLPERRGWVDRTRLYGFHGRNRKPQLALAAELGLEEITQPAGGCCFLTDPAYSRKLGDLFESRGARDYELDDIVLLKVGRHVRPGPAFKVIVGREDGENRYLAGYRDRFISLEAIGHEGPLALIDGTIDDEGLTLAARIVARYGQGRSAPAVNMQISRPDGSGEVRTVAPLRPDRIPDGWLL